jgi:hypothetical protein
MTAMSLTELPFAYRVLTCRAGAVPALFDSQLQVPNYKSIRDDGANGMFGWTWCKSQKARGFSRAF